jgi:hypothetical protein
MINQGGIGDSYCLMTGSSLWKPQELLNLKVYHKPQYCVLSVTYHISRVESPQYLPDMVLVMKNMTIR